MPDPVISNIACRCHVNDSNRTVFRYVISRLLEGYTSYRALPRALRRALLRDVIDVHTRNRELYAYVMKGGR